MFSCIMSYDLSYLKPFIESSPVVQYPDGKGGKYPYILLPGLDRAAPADVLNHYLRGMAEMLEAQIEDATAILTLESKGFIIAPTLAMNFDRKFIPARKRKYPGATDITIRQTKAYKEKEDAVSEFNIVGIKHEDKILIIDDMASSGGSINATIDSLSGYDIVGIGTLYHRADGVQRIQQHVSDSGLNIPVKGLIKVNFEEVKDKKGSKVKKFKPVVEEFWQR